MQSLRANAGLILAGVGMVMLTTVSFYLIAAYMPTYGRTDLKLGELRSLIVTGCSGLSNFIWLRVMDALRDRVGHKPLLVIASPATLLTVWPPCSGWSRRPPSRACCWWANGCRCCKACTTARWWSP